VLQAVSIAQAAKDAAAICSSRLNKARAHMQLKADSSSSADTVDSDDTTTAKTPSSTTATAEATGGSGSISSISTSTSCGFNPLYRVCCAPLYCNERYVHTLHACMHLHTVNTIDICIHKVYTRPHKHKHAFV
jgi:hypothetical protein